MVCTVGCGVVVAYAGGVLCGVGAEVFGVDGFVEHVDGDAVDAVAVDRPFVIGFTITHLC